MPVTAVGRVCRLCETRPAEKNRLTCSACRRLHAMFGRDSDTEEP